MVEQFTEEEIQNSIGFPDEELIEVKNYFRKWKDNIQSKKFEFKTQS